MKKQRCYIVGAGEFNVNIPPSPDDYVIAADGGFAVLASIGVAPDLVVGDFDSLGRVPSHPNVIRCDAEKDDTDMLIAVKEGLKLGFKEFLLCGSLGGRLDQSYANIQILAYIAEKGARGTLIGKDIKITAIKDGKLMLPPATGSKSAVISVFSHSSVSEGVTLKGVKYPLDNATLTSEFPLGVSNELIGVEAVIEVRKGTLIIMHNS